MIMIMIKEGFQTYFVEGILNAGFDYFGGDKCLGYIPFWYHLTACLVTIGFFGGMMVRYRK